MKKQKSLLILIAAELAKEWKNKIIYVKHEEMFRIKCNGDWLLTSDQKINRLIDAWLKKHPLMQSGYQPSFVLSIMAKLRSALNRNRPSTVGIKNFEAWMRANGVS